MDKPSEFMWGLAKQLIAAEAVARNGSDEHEAFRVCEKLRASVTRFAGADSFTALMRRSLAMSRADVPALETVKIGAGGCVDGLEKLANNGGAEAGAAITAHLLLLLITFIGETMALRLVREAWPDAALGD